MAKLDAPLDKAGKTRASADLRLLKTRLEVVAEKTVSPRFQARAIPNGAVPG